MTRLTNILVGFLFLIGSVTYRNIPGLNMIPGWVATIAGLIGLRLIFGRLIGILSIGLGILAFFSIALGPLALIGVPVGIILIIIGGVMLLI